MEVNFVFVGEGTSDTKLIPLLRELCMLCGADDAKGIIPEWSKLPKKVGHSISQKIKGALKLVPNAELLFIHRDADGPDPTSRYEEIAKAIESLGVSIPYVAVVPIQETEAWLLLDEDAIRRVARKPKGRMRLNLPSPKQVEKIANPKERLKEALAKASALKGRRLKSFGKKFSEHRQKLLLELDYSSPVSQVPAWQRLFNDTCQAIEKLRNEN
jgi:hypothetical protein